MDARPVCPQCGQINGFHRETCPLRHSLCKADTGHDFDKSRRCIECGSQKAGEHRHGATQDFVSYDPYGGVRVDMARYLRSPAGQAQLQELNGQKASERREYHANGTYWSGVPTVDMPCDFCRLAITAHDPRTHACPTVSEGEV